MMGGAVSAATFIAVLAACFQKVCAVDDVDSKFNVSESEFSAGAASFFSNGSFPSMLLLAAPRWANSAAASPAGGSIVTCDSHYDNNAACRGKVFSKNCEDPIAVGVCLKISTQAAGVYQRMTCSDRVEQQGTSEFYTTVWRRPRTSAVHWRPA